MSNPGIHEGEICNRLNCQGIIDCHPVENCSCHINPPCGACTTPRNFCQKCGWEEANDQVINDQTIHRNAAKEWIAFTPRPLDPTTIDWRSKGHTHFSMIKEGIYPEGTSRADVEKEVRGTFGGRFEYFGNGNFKYIAYTD